MRISRHKLIIYRGVVIRHIHKINGSNESVVGRGATTQEDRSNASDGDYGQWIIGYELNDLLSFSRQRENHFKEYFKNGVHVFVLLLLLSVLIKFVVSRDSSQTYWKCTCEERISISITYCNTVWCIHCKVTSLRTRARIRKISEGDDKTFPSSFPHLSLLNRGTGVGRALPGKTFSWSYWLQIQ